LDRRFGENDPTMTPEERMLERFTRERQRESKGALFNLEEEDELTHYGQSLSKLDDFDNVGLGLDDDDGEDAGQIDSRTVQNVHFGGFESDEDDDEAGVSGMGLSTRVSLLKSRLFSARAEENKGRSHG
jgi:nucleolar protein 14